MANVLITGASGFVGSRLCQALAARGDSVTCLVRENSKLDRLGPLEVRLVRGDGADPPSLAAAVAGQEVVYHVAGLTRALKVVDLYRVNQQGVGNVAEACAARPNPPVMVVVSSLAVAGPSPKGIPRSESDPPRPVSHYGRSKLAGERAARAWADHVPITIVRPPIVFGEGDRACLGWFKGIARFGIHVVPGWRRRIYSTIHVADLAHLLILAAERGGRIGPAAEEEEAGDSRGCYFADCGEHPTFAELGRRIGTALGRRRVLVWHLSMPVVWTVTSVSELMGRIRGRAQYLNFDKMREASAGNWICTAQRAAEELQFAAGAPLDARLRQTADWYRRKAWL